MGTGGSINGVQRDRYSQPPAKRRRSDDDHDGAVVPWNGVTLKGAAENVKLVLEEDEEWTFNIFELYRISQQRPLFWLGLSIFTKFGVHHALGCSEAVMSNWLQLMEAGYRNNAYHNACHAGDALQATAYFLRHLQEKELFNPLEEATCLLAAVMHDLDHPGTTNDNLVNSCDNMAILYNDISVLEMHHVSHAYKVTLATPDANIFRAMSKETYQMVRREIVAVVLATDLASHADNMKKFKGAIRTARRRKKKGFTPKELQTIKCMIMKAADISNPARPLSVSRKWAERFAEESYSQNLAAMKHLWTNSKKTTKHG